MLPPIAPPLIYAAILRRCRCLAFAATPHFRRRHRFAADLISP